MEAIVTKLLGKYFKLFIKDFQKDNFKLSILKGEGTLTNSVLNEDVLQEIMVIPTNLKIIKATCPLITVKISWTKLKEQPINVILEEVNLELEEPDVIPPMPTLFDQFQKSHQSKQTSASTELMLNLKLQVKKMQMTLKTRSQTPNEKAPHSVLVLKNIVVESVNSNWDVDELSKCAQVDPNDKNNVSYFKRIIVPSVSWTVFDSSGASIPLIPDLPVRIHVLSKWNMKQVDWLAGDVKIFIDNNTWQFDVSQLAPLREFFVNVSAAMKRPMSKAPGAETPKPVAPTPGQFVAPALLTDENGVEKFLSLPISLRVMMRKWVLQISSKQDGFRFEGEKIELGYSTAKTQKENMFESTASIIIPSFSFARLGERATKFVIPDENDTGGMWNSEFRLSWLKAKPTSPGEPAFQIAELSSNLRLAGVRVFYDPFVWEDMIAYFKQAEDPKDKKEQDQKEEEPQQKESKTIKESLDKLKNSEKISTIRSRVQIISSLFNSRQWHENITFFVDISNVGLYVVGQKYEGGKVCDMRLNLGKLFLMNQPSWKSIEFPSFARKSKNAVAVTETKARPALPPKSNAPPALPPKKNTLAQSNELPNQLSKQQSQTALESPQVKLETIFNAIQIFLVRDKEQKKEDVLFDCHLLSTQLLFSLETDDVLSGSDIKGSIFQLSSKLGTCHFMLNNEQLVEVQKFSHYWMDFSKHALPEQDHADAKNKAKEFIQDLTNTVKTTIKQNAKDIQSGQVVNDFKSQVKKYFEKHKVTCYLEADKSSIKLPFELISYVQNKAKFDKVYSLGVGKVQHFLCDSFTLGFTNASNNHEFSLVAKHIQARELGISTSKYYVELLPIAQSEISRQLFGPTDFENFSIYYLRNEELQTPKLTIRLQNTGITVNKRDPADLPDLKEFEKQTDKIQVDFSSVSFKKYIKKLTDFIDFGTKKIISGVEKIEKETDMNTAVNTQINAFKNNISNIKVDIDWDIEFAECDVVLANKHGSKTGHFKLSSTDKDDLMISKLLSNENKLRTLTAENESINSQLKQLQEKIAEMNKQKEQDLELFKQHLKDVQDQYIDTKMKLSEMQMAKSDLEVQLFEVKKQSSGGQKPLPAPPPPPKK